MTSPNGDTEARIGRPVTPTVMPAGDGPVGPAVAGERIAPAVDRRPVRHLATVSARPPEARIAGAAPYIDPVDVAVLVPVKRFTAAKGRLATVLGDDDRARCREWMASRVLDAVAELPTFVACDDPDVRSGPSRVAPP